MNELYDVLKTSKASDFLIREEQTESREAFFIGQKLDMSRAKKVTHTFLTVFVDSEDGKFRGSAEKEIHQGTVSYTHLDAASIIGEWNGPLTFSGSTRFAPASFNFSEASATAASYPVMTI